MAALSVAGDTSGSGFTFVGFLPQRGGERSEALTRLAANPATLLLFEAPHRIGSLLGELAMRCGPRAVTVCRELTKQFETVTTLPAASLPAWLDADPNRLRGEFVLVVHALPETAADPATTAQDKTLQTLLATLPLKQAVALAAELTGAPRNALYERALALKAAG